MSTTFYSKDACWPIFKLKQPPATESLSKGSKHILANGWIRSKWPWSKENKSPSNQPTLALDMSCSIGAGFWPDIRQQPNSSMAKHLKIIWNASFCRARSSWRYRRMSHSICFLHVNWGFHLEMACGSRGIGHVAKRGQRQRTISKVAGEILRTIVWHRSDCYDQIFADIAEDFA